ncbi:MAG: ABC transporter permease subunit, partial [Promethearchaeota archaeon]
MREMKELQKDLVLTVVIAISSLYIGLLIGFISFRLMPGDPVLNALGLHSWSEGLYNLLKEQLGFNLPIILQFIKYVGDLFSGYWGVSVSIVRNQPVSEMIVIRMTRSIDLSVISMVISITLGGLLGLISHRNRGKIKDKIIQIFSAFGIGIPIFFLGMILQYSLGYQAGWFETTGYLSAQYQDPPYVTGFIIIDAILAGQGYLIDDYIWHMILPVICVSFFMTSIIIWTTRYYMARKTHRNSVISVTIFTAVILGFVFMAITLIETNFIIQGVGKLFVDAILLLDYWVIDSILFIVLLVFVVATLFMNLIYILHKFLKNNGKFEWFIKSKIKDESDLKKEHNEIISENNWSKSPLFIFAVVSFCNLLFILVISRWIAPEEDDFITLYFIPSFSWNPPFLFIALIVLVGGILLLNFFFLVYKFSVNTERFKWVTNSKTEIKNQLENEFNVQPDETLKKCVSSRIRSPLIIIGAIIIVPLIFVGAFPQFISPYSYEYLLQPQAGSWNPPSPEHPLGQTVMGFDVLGRMIFGIQNSFIAGLNMVLIGLIGGIPLGYVAGRYKSKVHKPIMGSLILFYIFPGLVLSILTIAIYGHLHEVIMMITGILIIPNIARGISNEIYQNKDIQKLSIGLIKLIPFNFAVSLLIFHSLGFLGFNQSVVISLGNDINMARENPYEAPWANFWPNLASFAIIFSFLILHIGLQNFRLKRRLSTFKKERKL